MPSSELRQSVLASARRVVVKVGSAVLTDRRGRIEGRYVKQFAGQVAGLIKDGVEVTVVSSGAVAAGCAELGMKQRPKYVAEQQAVAAVGQRRLMTHMHDAFEQHGLQVGQILLTRGDFDDRSRFLNIRNCVSRLHKLGCVPIVNENDTVSVDEIRFGDNDVLAALSRGEQVSPKELATAISGRRGALVWIDLPDAWTSLGSLYLAMARRDGLSQSDRNALLERQENFGAGYGGWRRAQGADRIGTGGGHPRPAGLGRAPRFGRLLWLETDIFMAGRRTKKISIPMSQINSRGFL